MQFRRLVPLGVALLAVLSLGFGAVFWPDYPRRHAAGESPAAGDAPCITVFAAASTTDALSEIAATYQRKHRVRLRLNFASSSIVARQIEAGAPAEVFISANPRWMDYLESAGLIVPESRRDLLGNRLVIIAPKGEGFEVRIRPEFDLAAALTGRIALGNPEHVPAGMYARQALEHLSWYAAIRPRLVPCQNVRMALAAVELGEAAAGVVYTTDAHASEKVDILAVFPSESHSPIRYPAALCRGALPRASARAARFLDYLSGPEAADTFRRHGFVIPRRDGGPHGE